MPKIIENVRELIIEKAYHLFIKEGYDQVKTSRIAKECNIAAGTLFNYFPTKWDLLMEILFLIKQKGYVEFAEKLSKTTSSYDLIYHIVSEMHYVIERIGKLGKDFFIYLISREEKVLLETKGRKRIEEEKLLLLFKQSFPQLETCSEEIVQLVVRTLQGMVMASYDREGKSLERNKKFICRSFLAMIDNLDNIKEELQEVQ